MATTYDDIYAGIDDVKDLLQRLTEKHRQRTSQLQADYGGDEEPPPPEQPEQPYPQGFEQSHLAYRGPGVFSPGLSYTTPMPSTMTTRAPYSEATWEKSPGDAEVAWRNTFYFPSEEERAYYEDLAKGLIDQYGIRQKPEQPYPPGFEQIPPDYTQYRPYVKAFLTQQEQAPYPYGFEQRRGSMPPAPLDFSPNPLPQSSETFPYEPRWLWDARIRNVAAADTPYSPEGYTQMNMAQFEPFQFGTEGGRGNFRPGRTRIGLSDLADPLTTLHELGHLYWDQRYGLANPYWEMTSDAQAFMHDLDNAGKASYDYPAFKKAFAEEMGWLRMAGLKKVNYNWQEVYANLPTYVRGDLSQLPPILHKWYPYLQPKR